MDLNQINTLFYEFKTSELNGRYITNSDLEKCFEKLIAFQISTVGHSVESRPIYGLKLGKGPKKILIWSQMHGNESTTTKAIIDCLNLFANDNTVSNNILKNCTLFVIPILNPDGAHRYTRLNANKVDLNRDAQELTQPESKVLRSVFNSLKPDYCFNLHGQRTIFGSGNLGVSATLSFLSPSQDEERLLTTNREAAMAIISDIKNFLKNELPNGIARYDDGFNLNCVGDTFQALGVPTLLFEAGHYPNDYDREETRRFVFSAILKGLNLISEDYDHSQYHNYFKIPENVKCFYDVIIRNARISEQDLHCFDIGIQFKEVLESGNIQFQPVVETISDLSSFYGHKEIDALNNLVTTHVKTELHVGYENDFVLINTKKTALKP